MINMYQLGYSPGVCGWLYNSGDAITALAMYVLPRLHTGGWLMLYTQNMAKHGKTWQNTAKQVSETLKLYGIVNFFINSVFKKS